MIFLNVSSSKYGDICAFHNSRSFKICEVIIDFFAYQNAHFLLLPLNPIHHQDENWPNYSIT